MEREKEIDNLSIFLIFIYIYFILDMFFPSRRLNQFILPPNFMIGALRHGYTWEQIAGTIRSWDSFKE